MSQFFQLLEDYMVYAVKDVTNFWKRSTYRASAYRTTQRIYTIEEAPSNRTTERIYTIEEAPSKLISELSRKETLIISLDNENEQVEAVYNAVQQKYQIGNISQVGNSPIIQGNNTISNTTNNHTISNTTSERIIINNISIYVNIKREDINREDLENFLNSLCMKYQ